MPNIAMTFRFLDAGNQAIPWTLANQAVINTLGLTNVNADDPNRLTGRRNNVMSAAQCNRWTAIFDTLNASFEIFSDVGGQNAVGRDAPPCIGSLIIANAVTLYLKGRPAPVAVEPAVDAAVVAPAVVALADLAAITAFLHPEDPAPARDPIRVYIPASLSSGHQSTTCLIMRRLIDLGYTGPFEVIYVNLNGNATTIQRLLPELNIVVNGQDIAAGNYSSPDLGNNVFTFAIENDQARPMPLRQFGISGGVDAPNTDPRPICNVTYFLMLQPFSWPAANYLYPVAPDAIDLGNQALLGRLQFLGATCFWTDIAAYPWATVLPYVPGNKLAPVTAIQANCCTPGATKHLMPVYGLSRGVGANLSNWNALPQIEALANLVLAVLGGQTAGAPLNRGTVMMTLDTYAATWSADLLQLLPANYHARLSFWSVGSPWQDTMVTNLEANQILILNLQGGLPMPVFNYFYINSSLTPVFEGKGTMPIMLCSGRPYLQLSKQQNGFDTMLAVSPAPVQPVRRLRTFLYPSLPYQYNLNPAGDSETTTINGSAQACFDAQLAVVWNNPPNNIVVNAATFNVSGAAFITIRNFLQANFYINALNVIQPKFMALLQAADFEDNFPTPVISKQQMYNAMQAACTIGGVNACTTYRGRITVLSTFISNAITPLNAQNTYFLGLGVHFNAQANDKLLKGLGYAVAAIAAGM